MFSKLWIESCTLCMLREFNSCYPTGLSASNLTYHCSLLMFSYKSLVHFCFKPFKISRQRKPEVQLEFCVWPLRTLFAAIAKPLFLLANRFIAWRHNTIQFQEPQEYQTLRQFWESPTSRKPTDVTLSSCLQMKRNFSCAWNLHILD